MRDSYKDLTYEELHSKHEELKKKYMDIRFSSVLGHLDNPLEKRNIRRRIARLRTILHEYELGMRKR